MTASVNASLFPQCSGPTEGRTLLAVVSLRRAKSASLLNDNRREKCKEDGGFEERGGNPSFHRRVKFRLLLLLADGEQLDFKNQCFSGADIAAGAAIAVSKIGRDKQLPLRPDRHHL
jgi:hypothetical protein